MKRYLGLMALEATAMLFSEFCTKFSVAFDENTEDAPGFLTVDPARPANYEGYNGYVDWMPEDEFNMTFRANDDMILPVAIMTLFQGHKIAHRSWRPNLFATVLPSLALPAELTAPGIMPPMPYLFDGNAYTPWTLNPVELFSSGYYIVGMPTSPADEAHDQSSVVPMRRPEASDAASNDQGAMEQTAAEANAEVYDGDILFYVR